MGWAALLRPSSTPARSPGARLLCSAASGLPAAVQRVLERDLHLPTGSPLLISLSGGSDSVALFRLLLALSPQWRWRLHAVHFNHGLRAEADSEEAFVRALAAEHDVPIHVRRLAPHWSAGGGGESGDGGDGGSGVQERTRRWRRAESLEILSTLEAPSTDGDGDGAGDGVRGGDEGGEGAVDRLGSVALGHHADDQVETVLLKTLRGVHLSNVHGMRWREGAFVRPLLSERKSALQAYLQAIGQQWMEDSSNAKLKYKRNRVRLQLVPLLEDLSGGGGALVARVAAMEQQSAQLSEWLSVASASYLEAEDTWRLPSRSLRLSRLAQQPSMLRDELIHKLVADASGPGAPSPSYASLRHVQSQLEGGGGSEWQLDVTRVCTLSRVGDLLSAHASASTASTAAASDTSTTSDGRLQVGGATIDSPAGWRVAAGLGKAADADSAVDSADSVRLFNLGDDAALELRTWREGDTFHPPWRGSPVSLTAFLRGQRLSLEERRGVPLLCVRGASEVLAVFPTHEARGHVAKGHVEGEGEAGQGLWVALSTAD